MAQDELVQPAFFDLEGYVLPNPFADEATYSGHVENQRQLQEAHAYLGRCAYQGMANGAAHQAISLDADKGLLHRTHGRPGLRRMSQAMSERVIADAGRQCDSIAIIAGLLKTTQGDLNEYLPQFQMTRRQLQERHVASVAVALTGTFSPRNPDAAANRHRAMIWLNAESRHAGQDMNNLYPDPWFFRRLVAAAQATR